MRGGCVNSKRSAARSACRWWRRATCTCTSGTTGPAAHAHRDPAPRADRRSRRVDRTQRRTAPASPPRARQALPRGLARRECGIAARCTFTLDELRYRYPAELVPEGHTATSWLRQLAEEGARWRWPEGVPEKVHKQIEHELGLIEALRYESYFLTVHDIVRFARSQGILCQGRGSAANSSVCFALGVTEVDPMKMSLLVERFISKERNEPPDIDIDFEHERREEVIQYIYRKYGRERAALAATVICYRGKSAVRDVAKAMGLPLDQVDQLSQVFAWWDGHESLAERLRERGFDPESAVIRRIVKLTARSWTCRGTCRSTWVVS
jgi:error-prone DNA polymerase